MNIESRMKIQEQVNACPYSYALIYAEIGYKSHKPNWLIIDD